MHSLYHEPLAADCGAGSLAGNLGGRSIGLGGTVIDRKVCFTGWG
ncbi:MAG: hypothetical protein ACO34J_09295 [Prochlorothrix sp.]